MENQSTDKTTVKLSYESNDIEQTPITRLMDIVGNIRTVDTIPTHKPSDLVDQVLIYKNGTTKRYYYYDGVNDEWNYLVQSSIPQYYVGAINHDTDSLSQQTYTDTITSTFTPHTALFMGNYRDGTTSRIINGWASVSVSTTGLCTSNGTPDTTHIAYFGTYSHIQATTWSADGVTFTTKLLQNGGRAYFEGIVILIG